MTRHRALPMMLVIAATIATAAPSFAGMKLRFEKSAISVSGVTPGARTLWMAVIHEPGSHDRLRITDRSSVVVDDDRDGVVRLALSGIVRNESTWAVVDMTSGDHVIETPAPGRVRRVPLSAGLLHRKSNDHAASIENAGPFVVFWSVRPGVGAWKAVVDDGSATDSDGAVNGRVFSALKMMQAVDTTAAPPEDFERGDIILAVDLFSLDTFDVRVVP